MAELAPSDAAIEGRVRAALERSAIAYEEIACDPDFADTARFCERYGIAPEDSVNTILVASRRGPPRVVACLLLATTRLDVNGVVRRTMDARKASFASAAETVVASGMIVGGVTPFGLPPEIPIYVDARIQGDRLVWLGGGSRALKIGVPASALARLPGAKVVAELARDG